MAVRDALRPAAAALCLVAAAAILAAQDGREVPAAAGSVTFAPAGAPFRLSYRSLDPGEAILARLNADAPYRRVVLHLGFQERVLEPPAGDSPGSPIGLFGIDLGAKPEEMKLLVRAVRADGVEECSEWPLKIAARKFPTALLKVAPSMTNPPAELLETIRREQEMVAEVLGRVSPDWLAEGAFQSPLPAHEPFPNFGQKRIYNKAAVSTHAGVDIAAPRGTKAVAPNAGRIVLANKLYYSGWTVIIDHGRGVFTYCCHFDKVLVKRGDMVRKGQALAEVGSTGRSTGPHLHWSVRIFAARINPFSLAALPL